MRMLILGLGTNLGMREQHLKAAVAELGALMNNIKCSAVYESPALLPKDAPSQWNTHFLNMAVRGETVLGPRELLTHIKAIEHKMGRVARGFWGPREIDIDILALGNEMVAEPDLTIPHAELLKRDFALIPFAELAPEWVHPAAQKSVRELAAQMQANLVQTDIVII